MKAIKMTVRTKNSNTNMYICIRIAHMYTLMEGEM